MFFIKNRFDAFTLAEVLITLGIVGVVAVLTLPALIQYYQEQVIVSQAKKSYSSLLNAINLMKSEEGGTDYTLIFGTNETKEKMVESFAKYYKNAKVCTKSSQGCGNIYFVKLATPINDGKGSISKESFGYPRLLLSDGSLVQLRNLRPNCTPFTYTDNVKDDKGFDTGETKIIQDKRCATIILDVNGENKGPNQYGADVHQVLIYSDKITPNDSDYGALTNILKYNKLRYKKYPDSMTFDR